MSIGIFGECATPKCSNDAQWLPISLANKVGSDCPRFCNTCTEAVDLAFSVLEASRAQESYVHLDAGPRRMTFAFCEMTLGTITSDISEVTCPLCLTKHKDQYRE